MFYLSIYLFEIFLNQWVAFCAFFMPPTLVKLEGRVAFNGLSFSGWVYWGGCLLVGVYDSRGGGVCRGLAGWLGLLVTFLKL